MSTSPSSYAATTTIVGSGSRWYGVAGSGTSRMTVASPVTTLFARSRRPSWSTRRPSAISRWTNDRDRPVRSATKRSTRRTTWPAGTGSRRCPGSTDDGAGSNRGSSSSSPSVASGASSSAAGSSVTGADLGEPRNDREQDEQEDRAGDG